MARKARVASGLEGTALRSAGRAAGGAPRDRNDLAGVPEIGRGFEEQSRVWMPRSVVERLDRPAPRRSRPAYMTAPPVAKLRDDREIVCDEDQGEPEVTAEGRRAARGSAPATMTSSAGSWARRRSGLSGCTREPSAIAARWRIPPESSCGKRSRALCRNAHGLEQRGPSALRASRPLPRPCSSIASTI